MEANLYALLFLGFIIVQRLGELVIAKRNTSALMAKGAVEYGAEHYPFMVLLHTSWIIAMLTLGYDQKIILPWLFLYILLQGFRCWILMSLGKRWTTRIIVLNEPLVLAGPFKYFKHPNYMLVVVEIFVTPLVLGLTYVALLFTALNALMLFVRIRIEEKALAHLRKY